ncbi:hypothetical protein AB0C07_38700 [Actinoplanes missouriensis]|uniref:hypothetical protein n=1 Tax=Actinoplanes missouriensis TaxID=1866 RepID=UPI0033E0C224
MKIVSRIAAVIVALCVTVFASPLPARAAVFQGGDCFYLAGEGNVFSYVHTCATWKSQRILTAVPLSLHSAVKFGIRFTGATKCNVTVWAELSAGQGVWQTDRIPRDCSYALANEPDVSNNTHLVTETGATRVRPHLCVSIFANSAETFPFWSACGAASWSNIPKQPN